MAIFAKHSETPLCFDRPYPGPVHCLNPVLTPEDGEDFHGMELAVAMQQLPLISGSGWLPVVPLVDGRMWKNPQPAELKFICYVHNGSTVKVRSAWTDPQPFMVGQNWRTTERPLFTIKQNETKLNQDFDENSMVHSFNHDSWLRSWIMSTFLTHRLFEIFNRPTHLGRIPWLPEGSAKTMVGQWTNGEQVVGIFQLLFHWIKVVKLPCFTPR